MEKIKTDKVIVVEGKYDKIKLSSVIDANIVTTDGFSLFNNKEKCALLRRMAQTCGIIIFTDSDGSGFVIRNKIKSICGNCQGEIINLYAPQILGKEPRKTKASKQGLLGVEGISSDKISEIFKNAGIDCEKKRLTKEYTKTDMYFLGLSGGNESSLKRDEICKRNELPSGMSPNAFLTAVNLLGIELENNV